MRIQDAVLDYLNRNRGSYVSGEEIAASLGVTRNAVWKAIRKLEADGHRIDAVPKRGYALSADSDVLSAGSVSRYLTTDFPVRLDVRRAVTSTNTLLKAEAEQGAQEGPARASISASCCARPARPNARCSSRRRRRSPCAGRSRT